MRMLLLTGWLLLLVIGVAWHFGPGQDRLRLERVAALIAEADAAAADGQWKEAAAGYDDALRDIPAERQSEIRRVRLERAKAQMLCHKLPDAHSDLKDLVQEMSDDPSADPRVAAEARTTLANAQYYMTWLMRLEGLPAQVWEPEIEAARQNFTLLAEEAKAKGQSAEATRLGEDLESAVRLARMDLAELQGLPLPSQ